MKTILANGQALELPDKAYCIVPEQGIKVRVPGYTLIDGSNTIAYMKALDQRKWDHIRTGPLFQHLFNLVFQDCPECKIPETVANFEDIDDGILHISGMIIMAFEAMCERGENIFLDKPETHTHPRATRCLGLLINALRKLGGGGGKEVATA